MTDEASRALEQCLALPPEDRAWVAERLRSSLEEGTDQALSEAWVKEIESRIAAFERGELEGVPVEEAFERALKKCKR
ncbi:MAG: addiction module protein [Planctomycetota bacterium]